MKTFSATEAKNNFGAVLDAVETGPVEVQKNGKPAAYVLSAPAFAAMEEAQGLMTLRRRVLEGDKVVSDALRAYSSGKISKGAAMKTLSLANYSQLLDALGFAQLPLPELPAERIEAMLTETRRALKH